MSPKSTTPSDLEIHLASARRFEQNMEFGLHKAIEFALRWVDGIELDSIDFEPSPSWLGDRWGKRATVTLMIDGALHPFSVAIPQLLDEQAAASVRRPRETQVGTFRGTCWAPHGAVGRSRQPLVSYAWKPGVHHITSPAKNAGDAECVYVVGEFGSMWRLRQVRSSTTGGGRRGIVRIRHRTIPLAADRSDFEVSDPFDPASGVLDRLLDVLNDNKYRATDSPLTRGEVVDLVRRLVSSDAMAPSRVTMDPRNWRETGFFDQLSAAVALAVGKAARRIQRDRDHVAEQAIRTRTKRRAAEAPQLSLREITTGILSARIETAIVDAIDDVACGRGRYSGAVVDTRPINTLAALEASRQRTFLGFDGLEPYNGRLDLRVLPGGWQDRLCPLQTQESAAIGFVRHAALDGWTAADPLGIAYTYRDLSVAASLIPFIGHDDPTRAALGSKMFKQAVVLDDPQPPLIRTGAEALVGETAALRWQVTGVIESVEDDRVRVRTADGATVDVVVNRPGRQSTFPELPGDRWQPVELVPGTEVTEGDVFVHAPDVRLDENGQQPVLAYGRNATVGFLAWEGMNYEDGIVVSKSFSEFMRSEQVVQVALPSEPGSWVTEVYDPSKWGWDAPVRKGTELFAIAGVSDPVVMPEDGWLVPTGNTELGRRYVQRSRPSDFEQEIRFAYRVSRPLEIGDKLTTRHGGKGVVTRIEPDDRMPRLVSGHPIEVLLNPLGVIRRLNMGTLMELAQGLEHVLANGWDTSSSLRVDRRLTRDGRLKLARSLKSKGAEGGRLPFVIERDGTVRRYEEGAMIGPLYLVKLDHLASRKLSSRSDDAAPSPVTFQPVKASTWSNGRRQGSPQRIGEMELWSLEAVQAHETMNDLLAHRGVGAAGLREVGELAAHGPHSLLPAGLRASLAALAVAGIHFESADPVDPRGAASSTLRAITGGPGDQVQAVWRGRAEESGLADVITTFGADAFAQVRLITRDDKKKKQKKSDDNSGGGKEQPEGDRKPDFWKVAEEILARAIDAPATGSAEASALRERPRFTIVLPAPVDHPWVHRRGRTLSGLPPLHHVALLPASAYRAAADDRRDPLRRRYVSIIRWVLTYSDDHATSADKERALALIDRHVRALLGTLDASSRDTSTIAGRLTGKFGLLRRNGLGAAAIRSGRAVLVGDPRLDPQTVKLPRSMARDLGFSEADIDEISGLDDADRVVLVNRQPTLHPYNLQALRAQIWDKSAVALHPILLTAIAGDFDGDTVAVHRFTSRAAREEIWRLRRPAAALRSGASGTLLAKLDQDVKLGFAVSDGLPSATPQGAAEAEAQSAASADAGLEAIARLQREGLLAAFAWRPSVVDLKPPVFGSEKRWSKRASTRLEKFLAEDPSLDVGVRSGALKSAASDELRHWLGVRGSVSLPFTGFPETEIAGNYLDGLEDRDYFAACQPAILGLARKKLLTPHAGALTRALVRHGYGIRISSPNCYEDGRAHDIFECTSLLGPCAEAYGDNRETGERVSVGEPVGVRAALFIGQTGTQKALKSIHDRSAGDEGEAVLDNLAAILLPSAGTGGLTRRIRRVLKDFDPSLEWDHERFVKISRSLLAQFHEKLPKEVDSVHAQLLIRHSFLAPGTPGHVRDSVLPPGTGPADVFGYRLLASMVWAGGLTDRVFEELGARTRTVQDPTGRERQAVRDEPEDGRREQRSERIFADEPLLTTIRNARSTATGGGDG